MRKPFTVARMLELMRATLQLELIGDDAGLARDITSSEVSSPGLVLAGYVERFPASRLQVFGETEITYLNSLSADQRRHVLELFFSFDIPCAVVTKGQDVPPEMQEIAGRRGAVMSGERARARRAARSERAPLRGAVHLGGRGTADRGASL